MNSEEIEHYQNGSKLWGDLYYDLKGGKSYKENAARKKDGIVHTPPAVVKFMNDAVRYLAKQEGGAENVQLNVVDPFMGANANFLLYRVLAADPAERGEVFNNLGGIELNKIDYWGGVLELCEGANITFKQFQKMDVAKNFLCGDTFLTFEQNMKDKKQGSLLSDNKVNLPENYPRSLAKEEDVPPVIEVFFKRFHLLRSENLKLKNDRQIKLLLKPLVQMFLKEIKNTV